MSPRCLGHLINETGGEQATSVEIAIAIVHLAIQAVGDHPAVLAHLIQGMYPGEGDLRCEAVVGPELHSGLKGVVVGCANALELVDRAESRARARRGDREV